MDNPNLTPLDGAAVSGLIAAILTIIALAGLFPAYIPWF